MEVLLFPHPKMTLSVYLRRAISSLLATHCLLCMDGLFKKTNAKWL